MVLPLDRSAPWVRSQLAPVSAYHSMGVRNSALLSLPARSGARPFWDTHGMRIQYWDTRIFHNAVSTYFDVSGRKSRGLCPLRPPSVVGCSESGARTVNGDGALVVARRLSHWVSQFSVVGGGFRWVSKFRFFVSDGAPISRANYLDLFESSAAEK